MNAAPAVDALAHWGRMCQAVETANALHGRARDEDRWRRRAARFDRMTRQRTGTDPTVESLLAHLAPGDVVVDVGAGTGRHALPLAGHCRRLVAVEPSAAMRGRLESRLQAEAVANVEMLPTTWPAAGPLACDVIYSSHVLYGVREIVPFVETMTRSARRDCLLLLGMRAPADAMRGLWRIVHGSECPVRPAAPEALAVLRQLHYAAELDVVPASEYPVEFGESPEDVHELCHRLGLEPDPDSGARVRGALTHFGPPNADGRYRLGTQAPVAVIRWPGGRSR